MLTDEQTPKDRSIVFIAFDIGGIILKKAGFPIFKKYP
jgi:hypothetical protein